MLQWRNWHTRQIQTLFSPGSTPGWSTIFEINSGGDFVNNISAVAIGMLIAAHREGDEEKFRAYVELIAETYEQQGNDHAANIIRSYYTGDYGEQGKVILDEATEQTTYYETGWYEPDVLGVRWLLSWSYQSNFRGRSIAAAAETLCRLCTANHLIQKRRQNRKAGNF